MPRINMGLGCFSNELNLNTVLIVWSCSPMQSSMSWCCVGFWSGGAIMRQIKGIFLLVTAMIEGC